jgi:hypothetical protein
MAERTMLVCDTCGRPAVETVTFKTTSGNRQRDYCSPHLAELLAGSRTPKRGRRPGSSNAAAKKSGARSAGRKKATARKTRSKKKVTAKG